MVLHTGQLRPQRLRIFDEHVRMHYRAALKPTLYATYRDGYRVGLERLAIVVQPRADDCRGGDLGNVYKSYNIKVDQPRPAAVHRDWLGTQECLPPSTFTGVRPR